MHFQFSHNLKPTVPSKTTNTVESLDNSLFSKFKILTNVKICVVIPVKDEEEHIENTLNAFINQTDRNGLALDCDEFEILILANNCSDRSVSLIENFSRKYPNFNIYFEEITLNLEQANIGHVRKLLMDSAFNRLSENGGGIIMTTDGDTEVAKNWIAQNKFEIENGAEAVGGRILLKGNDLQEMDEFTRSIHLADEKYQLLIAEAEAKIMKNPKNTHPTHHQHFNGSFAITTECYEKSGGVPEVPFLEDCALVEELQKIDVQVRHSNNVKVHTSARCIGRTQVGLSYQLNIWKNLEKNISDIYVECADSIIDRFKTKKRLHDSWLERSENVDFNLKLSKILNENNLNEKMINSFKSSKFFGEWYFEFIQLNNNNFAPVTIETAISDLEKAVVNL